MKRRAGGVFAGAAAMDFVDKLVGELAATIENAVAEPGRLEPDEYYGQVVPCIVAILAGLHELTGTAAIPEPTAVAGWKAKYMETWESCVAKAGGGLSRYRARRAALNAVFDNLERMSREIHEQPN